MGAGQSKQPPQPTLAPSTPAEPSPSPTTTAAAASSTNNNANESSSPSSASKEGGGGGCPMKNADGSYRIMPGFASLFKGRHPPVDPSKINAASPASPAPAASVDSTASESSAGSSSPSDTAKPVVSGGCPVKHDSSKSWNILRRGGSGPGSDNNAQQTTTDDNGKMQQQYDVYSRPLPMDPTNNMPIVNPSTIARNSLPAPQQSAPLPTDRIASTIPKSSSGSETWTYPSPQMFYNALARKGKLDEETKEEDMISVVAIHNCMNEGTWDRILQWEKVLSPPPSNDDKESNENNNNAVGPALTKFMGRPTDLSPKAFFKHYLFNHPLPFDRHDWTVTRTDPTDGSTKDVRYVIDYYHDDNAAKDEEGSGLPAMNEGIGSGGKIQSLLVDVRPAADSLSEIWGRMIDMPLARRGCRSILECVLFKGHGSARNKSEFEPLPLKPSESLKDSLKESQEVWDNIQKDAANKKGVGAKDDYAGEACASDSLEGEMKGPDVTNAAEVGRKAIADSKEVDEEEQTIIITKAEAKQLVNSYSQILSQCQESKSALQSCSSEEECQRAYLGMTVCAGKFLCPLQHGSLLESLASHDDDGSSGGNANDEMAEAKISTAMDVLGECVANCDARAGAARQQFPKLFEEILKKDK